MGAAGTKNYFSSQDGTATGSQQKSDRDTIEDHVFRVKDAKAFTIPTSTEHSLHFSIEKTNYGIYFNLRIDDT